MRTDDPPVAQIDPGSSRCPRAVNALDVAADPPAESQIDPDPDVPSLFLEGAMTSWPSAAGPVGSSAISASAGSASKGVNVNGGRLLSRTRYFPEPTKNEWFRATSRLNTGCTTSGLISRTSARPVAVRTNSPGFRSRAMAQPRPGRQKRWTGVQTTVSSFTRIRTVSAGGLWWIPRIG